MSGSNDLKKRAQERAKKLVPAAFGVHSRVDKDLRELFEKEADHRCFFYYEVFLDRPFLRDEKWAVVGSQDMSFSLPFLAQRVEATGFVPLVPEVGDVYSLPPLPLNEIIDLVPAESTKKHATDPSRFFSMSGNLEDGETAIGELAKTWLEGKPPTPKAKLFGQSEEVQMTWTDGCATVELSSMDGTKVLDFFEQKARALSWTETTRSLLCEFELVFRPWLRLGVGESFTLSAVSISSHNMFWGETILLCPSDKNASKVRGYAIDKIKGHVKDSYVPMLTLFENYVIEDRISPAIKDDRKENTRSGKGFNLFALLEKQIPSKRDLSKLAKNWLSARISDPTSLRERLPDELMSIFNNNTGNQNPFLRLLTTRQVTEEKKFPMTKIERNLIELWCDRVLELGGAENWYDRYDQEKAAARVEDSLVFAKYLVSSPAMITLVEQAMDCRQPVDLRKSSEVSTALVVGSPGSGKDSMAQLLRLFSPGYRLGACLPLNMAMYRPKEAAVPLLLGADIKYKRGGPERTLSSIGQLRRYLDDPKYKNKKDKRAPTIILDELNSLDIDTQGALLRFLENAELASLGSTERNRDDQFHAFVIGIVNEDPQKLTKRQMLDRVLEDRQLFGGLLGELVYEFLRNQRRLRDDLYFRLIRGGEIHLPLLKDRPEDLPALFYFCLKEQELMVPAIVRRNWYVLISAYEEISQKNLKWRGNMRELQEVARRTLREAVCRWELDPDTLKPLTISSLDVHLALDAVAKRERDP